MIGDLYARLQPDPWRQSFSDDISAVHERIFRNSATKEDIAGQINLWLTQWQPCLFGRLAARQNLLRYCVLTADDLAKSDEELKTLLQRARSSWLRDAFDGYASGYIVLAISEALALARPNSVLLELSAAICSMHLFEQAPVVADDIRLDNVYLEKPGASRRTWKWGVGMNFFGAQGDGRWWRDHRIPGGIAISMNSVGHMAKSGAIHKAMRALDESTDAGAEEWTKGHVDSVATALTLAMRTIKKSSEGPVPGTGLYKLDELPPALKCPTELPPDLKAFNHCTYHGQYHTDHTIPTAYFRDDVERPEGTPRYEQLDFSYLFDQAQDDYRILGEGLQIRGGIAVSERGEKRPRATAVDVSVDDEPLLLAALRERER